jgi:hypothetical protein
MPVYFEPEAKQFSWFTISCSLVKVILPDSNEMLLPEVISESFIIYLAFDSICHQYP